MPTNALLSPLKLIHATTGCIVSPGLWVAHKEKWEMWREVEGKLVQLQCGREKARCAVTKPLSNPYTSYSLCLNQWTMSKSTAHCAENGQV
jgi:hypothetical protein